MAVVSCGNCNHDAGSFSEHAPILGADGRGVGRCAGCPTCDEAGKRPRYRTGQTKVVLDENTPGNQLRGLIESAVERELSTTNEWPVRIEYQTGRPVGGEHSTLLAWEVSYTTGPHGTRTY